MAFWGVEVKPGKPVTHSCEKARGRLRISQATLGISDATKKSLVQCNVGNRSPVLLCALLPNSTESCHLDVEFEEADDVVFSVIGPRSVYLTGYYVQRSLQSNTHSDTESYGVDIENSHTEGSSHDSADDRYEDSFIDDDELQVSPPSPVSSEKGTDEARLGDDRMHVGKGRQKNRKKKYQVIESDSEDDNGYLLSVFKNKRSPETTMSKDGKKSAQVTEQTGSRSDGGICDSESPGKGNPSDVNVEQERLSGAKLPFLHKGTEQKNKKLEIVKELETHNKVLSNNEKALTDRNCLGNKVEVNIIDQNLPMRHGDDQMQSLDVAKAKKKRKEKVGEVGDPKNLMEMGANWSATNGAENDQKSKKRKKGVQLERTCEGTDSECHSIPKHDEFKQGLLNADSVSNELLEANGKHQEPKNDNIITTNSELLASDQKTNKKVRKKKQKKSEGDGSSDVFMPKMTDNKENSAMKYEHQTANAPIQERALSNGLIIEEVTHGPPDGKVAAPGKKVKIYYTAMLKESGHIFDSNVGKPACKFLLGDKEVIGGWNLGIDGMRVGDKRRLVIPPSMGYGKHGAGENVPPNSWLVYEVELASVRG
ncbi:LOW QUALITY PROTEIN: peptidyl-prolyl cis-trans isomerase FKBP43-like [Primulina eburnea]|uniref:LOW QUALITY PROTEIN: peptidyl-prolyl cis-trans isomerase FKBP43-like n=1 Tax=Primulina eburnea TaxID=1245227 RepID=UPI003C6C9EB4